MAPPALLLARTKGAPGAIALNTASVYFMSGDQLAEVPKHGGTEPHAIARGPALDQVAADEENVYWIDVQTIKALAGGSTRPLQVVGGEREYRDGLVLDERWLYWGVHGSDPHIERAPKARRGATAAGPDPTWPLRLLPRSATVIDVDADWVYCQMLDTRRGAGIVKVSKRGALPPIVMADDLTLGGRPAVNQNTIYFGDSSSGAVVRIEEGTKSRAIIATGQVRPGSVLVDDRAVYWNDASGLMRARRDGGTPERIALHPGIWRMAQDRTDIYWISDTTVARIPKAAPTIP